MFIKKALVFLIVIFFLTTELPLFSKANSVYSETIKNSISSVFFVGGNGTGNYTKIQDAINNATNGDTVFVFSGTYYEQIVIDKSIYLIGENKYTTIIDAGGNGDALNIIADGLYFCNFTIQHTGIGNTSDVLKNSAIEIFSSNSHIIKNVICRDTNYGIWTEYSDNNLICDNIFYAYYDGISLDESKNNILRNNSMFGPGLVLSGSSIELLTHDIDDSNTANGKPVYYYLSKDSITVPNNAGQVILVNCSNCTVADLEISKVTDGIELLFSDNNTIKNNIITNTTDFGIRLCKSNNNIIKNNKIAYCFVGVGFTTGGFDGFKRDADCRYNTIINNSFEFNEFGIFLVMSNYNQILSNNFIKSKNEHARFVCAYCNHWSKNYWDDWIGLKYNSLRFFPKIIFGSPIKIVTWRNLWMNFDWNLAEEPYFDSQCTKIIYVDDDGCADYESIQDAINISNAGDTIYVYNGTYYENIVIEKSILLTGENKENTIIDGDKKGAVIISKKQGIEICGFTLRNAEGKWGNYCAGVKLTASNNIIHDNIISHNMFGIHGWNVTNTTIYNNIFIDDGINFGHWLVKPALADFIHNITNNTVNGKPLYYFKNQNNFTVPNDAGQIIAANCTNMIIKDVNITKTDFPIIFGFCSECFIENSKIIDNGGELWLAHCKDCTIQNNNISKCAVGVCLQHESHDNIVRYNFVSNCVPCGISIEIDSYNNTIYENMITLNKKGVWIHNSYNNNISRNTISRNSKGGILLSFSNQNKIIENNIIKNKKPVACFVNSNNNVWDKNYWDGPRLIRKPILGLIGPETLFFFYFSVPIPTIPSNFDFDLNPAKEPYN
jgi:parallel beta-helix repeat protein